MLRIVDTEPNANRRRFVGDDEALVVAFRMGDRAAQGELYARYSNHVSRVLGRVLGADAELADLIGKVLNVINKGRFTRRTDAPIIAEEVRRLTGTQRGWTTAVERLKVAGEYAIPYMLDAMADNTRKAEYPNIVRALPYIGRNAIRPLVAALQTENIAIKGEIIKALGAIG